jgi:hypothetical protein
MANKRHIRLRTQRDVQRFLGRLSNEVYRGEIGVDKAKVLCHLSRVLLDSFKGQDLERVVKEPVSVEGALRVLEKRLLGVDYVDYDDNGSG